MKTTHSGGMTLVELMVTVCITFIVMACIGTLLINTVTSWSTENEVIGVNQSISLFNRSFEQAFRNEFVCTTSIPSLGVDTVNFQSTIDGDTSVTHIINHTYSLVGTDVVHTWISMLYGNGRETLMTDVSALVFSWRGVNLSTGTLHVNFGISKTLKNGSVYITSPNDLDVTSRYVIRGERADLPQER